MKTVLRLNGKKVTRHAVENMIGKERMSMIMEDANRLFLRNHGTHNDFYITGDGGVLTVEFD